MSLIAFTIIFLFTSEKFQINRDPSTPEIQLYQNLTLKIQVGPKISVHIPFVTCQSATRSWDVAFSKFDLKNQSSTVITDTGPLLTKRMVVLP